MLLSPFWTQKNNKLDYRLDQTDFFSITAHQTVALCKLRQSISTDTALMD